MAGSIDGPRPERARGATPRQNKLIVNPVGKFAAFCFNKIAICIFLFLSGVHKVIFADVPSKLKAVRPPDSDRVKIPLGFRPLC